MRKVTIIATIALLSLGLSVSSQACDMHGAGYAGHGAFGMSWQPYNPMASTTDPALFDEGEGDIMTRLLRENRGFQPKPKPKPSFSGAAQMAAFKAQAKLAKKRAQAEDDRKDETQTAQATVQPTSLDANR